jgi:hypothetical protein
MYRTYTEEEEDSICIGTMAALCHASFTATFS